MKEHPILFSTPMVQAIIEGRKTQTRRIIKPKDQPFLETCMDSIDYSETWGWHAKRAFLSKEGLPLFEITQHFKCPYGKQGDLLWVRETWGIGDKSGAKYYRANTNYPETICKWRPSIFMTKAASRIYLQVTDIRIERLQDISQEDSQAEGVLPKPHRCEGWTNPTNQIKDCFKCSFKFLWNTINGELGYGWDANPWVWAISFRVLSSTGRPANLEELCQAK